MKHIRKFESYRNTKRREEIIKESVLQVNDIYKVRTLIDIPQSLINAYVKKVKDTTGKNLRQFFGDVDIAEEIVKYVTLNFTNVDQVPAGALTGDAQTAPEGQAAQQAQAPGQAAGAQLYGQGYGQAAATQYAGAQNAANLNAGFLSSLISSAAGGFGNLFSCWVAREVYGIDNPKWVIFREWLYTNAPKWFLKLYEKHGEQFAKFISNKPMLKSIIRKWMDGRIKNLNLSYA